MVAMPTKNASLEHVLATLQAQLEAIRAHEAGTRTGRDPEDLHNMRVAVRRFRAILRACRPLFDAKWVEGLRSELDWLGTALGETRDLDVLRAHLDSELASLEGAERKAGQVLLRRLDADRARAKGALRGVLDGQRYAKLLTRLKTSLADPRVASSGVSLVASVGAEFKKLRRAVKALPGHPSAEDLHEIRIKVKRVRYAAELVRAAAGGRGERFIDQAKTLQDILGEHQDAVVLEEYLHEVIGRREGTHELEQQLLKRQRKRRKKTRAAFFEEWPRLERRGRRAWSTASMPKRFMNLLLIRHAPAVRNGSAGIRDHDRPLTRRGRARFRRAARGLARIAGRPDVLLTSPLTRARATADIAAAAFKRVTPKIEPALGQDDVEMLVTALKKYRLDATVALVGHEPHLSALLAHLLGMHQGDDRFAFKKGGAALVHLPDGPSVPGQLRWFLKPRILRALGVP